MKFLKQKYSWGKGFSILEVILVVALFTVFSVGVFTLAFDSLERNSQSSLDSSALFYAQEGIEAVRSIRDRNFLLVTNGDHGLSLESNQWVFVEAPENIDDFFERVITVGDVYRDVTGDISDSGTVFDPDTKKVTSEVSWVSRVADERSVKLMAYVTNWRGSDWVETTCTDFSGGTLDSVILVNLPSPPDDNCGLQVDQVEGTPEFFASVNLGKHANDVVVDGNYAYLAADDDHEGLAIADVSDPQNPVIISNLDVGGKGRYVRKDGNYLYMGVDSINYGLVVVNVASPYSPVLISSVDIGGRGNRPTVRDGFLYMGASGVKKLLVYNVADPYNVWLADFLDLDDSVYVSDFFGNDLFLGTADDDEGLVVLDISNPLDVAKKASLDVSEEVNAIAIKWPVLYLGSEESSRSLVTVDISDIENMSVLGRDNVYGEIQDLVILENRLYAALDETHSGLAKISISDQFDPQFLLTLDVSGKGTGIDAETGYVFVSTDTSNKGLVIIHESSSEYVISGEYISVGLDTGSSDPEYKFIEWNNVDVPGGNAKVQIRTADTLENLDIATWVGSDGTAGTYYEVSRTPIVLSADRSGSRFVQFRVLLFSDGASTPTFESIRINFVR